MLAHGSQVLGGRNLIAVHFRMYWNNEIFEQ
jgi:hypothetical protein